MDCFNLKSGILRLLLHNHSFSGALPNRIWGNYDTGLINKPAFKIKLPKW